uniref:Putative ankyrin repeat and dhhc-type zn-finger domain protein n=1 Tax=Anopheles marajoara TaxID=58244 RepID=A0A2M4BAD8_9DIPT
MATVSYAEPELRNAFDRFSLWILSQNLSPKNSVKLVSGARIKKELRNYLVALTTREAGISTELHLLEHHLTKRQHEQHSSGKLSDGDLATVFAYFDLKPPLTVHYYVSIGRESIEPESPVMKCGAMDLPFLQLIPSNVLPVISNIRELPDANIKCAYERIFSNGRTLRAELQDAIEQQMSTIENATSEPRLYFTEALPMCGVELEALATAFAAEEGTAAPLGLLIIRQGSLEHINRYIKKNCVEREEDVTSSTWLLISDTVPFEASFPTHDTVHEVTYLLDYGLVFWLRSKGDRKTAILQYFTVGPLHELDVVPPAPGWLNVLTTNETNGCTTYLRSLRSTSQRTDPFRAIAHWDASEAYDILLQRTAAHDEKKWFDDTLCALFGATIDDERFAVRNGQLLLLIDHATEDCCTLAMMESLIKWLNIVDHATSRRLIVWIVGDDQFWKAIVTHSHHTAVRHSMPMLNEREQRECLTMLLPTECSSDVDSILKYATESNCRKYGDNLRGNVFFLAALAEAFDHIHSIQPASCSWIELMERYISNHLAAPADSERLVRLEEECFRKVTGYTATQCPMDREKKFYKHRTLLKFLAASYLQRHPERIDLHAYHAVDKDILDQLLFRHSALALAILRQDVEQVRNMVKQGYPDSLRSHTDHLQRNLLHIIRESVEIADMLLDTNALELEQRCAQLNNWTPLEMGDDREDWPIVDRLLAKGASFSATNALKLHTMSPSQLSKVFNVCIGNNCVALVDWILQHRPDYRISQYDLYCLSVHQEFDRDLTFRLLALAKQQHLPDREPIPYRFIWDNSALDNAVADWRYELAAYLVEHLAFEPTEEFRRLEAASSTEMKSEDAYELLNKLYDRGLLSEMYRLIEEKQLDPSRLFIRAASSGDLSVVQALFENYGLAQRSIDDENDRGQRALAEAQQNGHQEVIRYLQDVCGAISHANEPHRDRQDDAAEDFESIMALGLEELRQSGIDYTQRSEYGESYLHYYIRNNNEPDEAVFRYLLSRYDTVDIRCQGETALHIALVCGNELCVRLLIEQGANVFATGEKDQLTSLHFAAMSGKQPLIDLLIVRYGFNVNVRDLKGRTIAFYLPTCHRLFRHLIDRHKLDVTGCDDEGLTLLHESVLSDSYFATLKVEFVLRQLQFPQTLTDSNGRLALHCAVQTRSTSMVALLLKYRSDLFHVPDNAGVSALQLAQSMDLQHVVRMFQSLQSQ